jgi:ATP-dependent DNA helicase RecG
MMPKAESLHTEFKTSFSDEVIISLVAFCNAGGGAVYLGVEDNGNIKGIVLGKESIAEWLNEIKSKTTPAIIPNVDIQPHNDKTIVVFSVAEYPVKPVAMKGRYFQRRANANHQLSAIEIADLSIKSRLLSWDSYPYTGASFDDLNIEKINSFIRKVNDVGRFTLPTEARPALEKLAMLHKELPTNAAMILFSKNDLRYNVHIGRFKTPSLIIADKMISGNLFDVLEEAMQTIIGHLKFAFEITGKSTERLEIPEYPLDAIRELLVNSIVHRDYQSPTDIQIRIYDDSISFFNPSGLFGNITEEDLKTDSYQASTRNKQIAEAFYPTNEIEKYGSGFIRIRKAIAAYPTMKFEYRNMNHGFLAGFSYVLQKISMNQTTVETTVDTTVDTTVETTVETLLQLIRLNPEITQNELMIKLKLSRRGVEWHIKNLKDKGVLERYGSQRGKGGYWVIPDK